jgi:hypothetical protein
MDQDGIAVVHLLEELVVLLVLDVHQGFLVIIEDILYLLDVVVLCLPETSPFLCYLNIFIVTFD